MLVAMQAAGSPSLLKEGLNLHPLICHCPKVFDSLPDELHGGPPAQSKWHSCEFLPRNSNKTPLLTGYQDPKCEVRSSELAVV